MNLFGLSPTAFLLGALALAGALVALHLLRVRLRRVEVDTLLFFRLAGALQKPRVLPGRPARWLALALALLTALAAWAALAQPRSGLERPSRVLVVEPDATHAADRLAQIRDVVAQGLGPRGMVLVATSPPQVLWRADESAAALQNRSATLAGAASAHGAQAALRTAAEQQRPGDELLWLGAAPLAGAVHVPTRRASAAQLTQLDWQRERDGAATLLVRGHGLRAGELRDGDTVLARAQVDARFSAQSSDTPWTALRLGPCPPPERPLRLLLEGFAPLEVPAPRGTPLRVAAAGDLDAELARALDALLAVDAEFTRADTLDAAEVVVAAADDPADPRPRLVLTPGAGDGPRHAVLAPSAPLHLSLRDGKRRAAPALPALAGSSNVWIADAAQGATLAAATLEGARRRVHVVAWLLLPITRADAPELLGSALRTLGGRPQLLLALAGQPLEVAAGHGDAARLRDVTVPALDGAWRVRSAAPGEAVLATAAGPRALVTLAPQSLASPRDVPAAEREARGGAGAWSGWLLALLVVLLAADAYFFHRGRLP